MAIHRLPKFVILSLYTPISQAGRATPGKTEEEKKKVCVFSNCRRFHLHFFPPFSVFLPFRALSDVPGFPKL